MSTITGYKNDTQGAWIPKDPEAQLVYSMDWSEWLSAGQTISSVTYTENSRINDTAPLVIESSGISNAGTLTYAEISGGAQGKTYTVTADITTDNGATDRRAFKILVQNRFAQAD
jgi:hypothetical protein